jgi:type IV pilus assembly protein PilC
MMRAGIPLVQALDIVIQGLEQRGLKTMTNAIRSDIAAGNRLASSLRRYPQAFDELYCNLVEVGENSGALEEMLDRLATFREKSAALRSKVRKAMYYPMAIVAVAVIVTGILLVKMVPTLAQTFAGFGAELPVFTQFVIGLSDWVIETWWICLASAALFALLAPRAIRASRRLRRGLDRVMLALPIFGKIARTSCYARFARTLATTYAAGVPLVEALHSVAGATGNAVYEDATHDIATAVSGGAAAAQVDQRHRPVPVYARADE